VKQLEQKLLPFSFLSLLLQQQKFSKNKFSVHSEKSLTLEQKTVTRVFCCAVTITPSPFS
jgi:hypothetical protein